VPGSAALQSRMTIKKAIQVETLAEVGAVPVGTPTPSETKSRLLQPPQNFPQNLQNQAL